jgi:hypothetical protein
MTPERLAEITQFAEAYKGSGLVRGRPNSAIAHRGELLAEVRRLADENRQLHERLAAARNDLQWERHH